MRFWKKSGYVISSRTSRNTRKLCSLLQVLIRLFRKIDHASLKNALYTSICLMFSGLCIKNRVSCWLFSSRITTKWKWNKKACRQRWGKPFLYEYIPQKTWLLSYAYAIIIVGYRDYSHELTWIVAFLKLTGWFLYPFYCFFLSDKFVYGYQVSSVLLVYYLELLIGVMEDKMSS